MLQGHDVGMSPDEPVPEADAQEQQQVVVPQPETPSAHDRGEVPEADWLEQSVVEPYDDEDR